VWHKRQNFRQGREMLSRSVAARLAPAAWSHLRGAWELPVCVCGATKPAPQLQWHAHAAPWAAHTSGASLLLQQLPGSPASVRHFLGGLVEEPSKTYNERRLLG
jgi:hypothetical protein